VVASRVVETGARGAARAAVVAAAGDKAVGTVKWFDNSKGFGFIMPEDGGEDVFVHQTVIHSEGFRSLAEGETVEFEIQTDDSGRTRAVDVTGPDGAYVQGAPRPDRRDRDDDDW